MPLGIDLERIPLSPTIAAAQEDRTFFCRLEHTRHRSVANCFVNLLAGLIAYTYREKKPSLNIRVKEQLQLSAVVC